MQLYQSQSAVRPVMEQFVVVQ
uniref:Uncharacterized protein n=1 Tax=Anguilla anguilla TaxID=7936 RepID=A0A0E9V5F8_ANGAN